MLGALSQQFVSRFQIRRALQSRKLSCETKLENEFPTEDHAEFGKRGPAVVVAPEFCDQFVSALRIALPVDNLDRFGDQVRYPP
jgi:hypothetical protein